MHITVNKKKWILSSFCFLFLISVYSLSLIKIETNIVEYFKANSSIRQSLEFVETKLAGVEFFDIALSSNETEAFKNPIKLRIIEKIENYLLTIPGVDKNHLYIMTLSKI